MSGSTTIASTAALHLLPGAYAVDALAPDECEQFEAHLHDCIDCRTEVAELGEALTTLAGAVSAPPPPALLANVLTGISRVRPLPPLPVLPAVVVPPACERRARPRRRLVGLVAAAAAIAAVGVGVTVWPQGGDTAQVSAASLVIHAADAKRSSVDFERGATATVYHSDSLHQAVLVADGMPPAPEGMVYAVWLDQPASGLVAAGFLAGSGDQSVVLSGDAATANNAAITLEPVGGSTSPTSDPVAVFDFGQGA